MASMNPNPCFSGTSAFRFILIALVMWSAAASRVPRAAHAEPRYYAIQVGAYQDLTGAERMVSRLKSLGHEAYYRRETSKGKELWFRVYIDRFPSRGEAVKEAKILKELGLISDYAVRAPGDARPSPPPSREKTGVVWYLHVSSFKDKINAVRKTEALERHGRKAFFVEEKVAGKPWYRVYIGEFGSEAEAEKAGHALMEKNLIDYFKTMRIDQKALLPGD